MTSRSFGSFPYAFTSEIFTKIQSNLPLRPPPISDHFSKIQKVFKLNYKQLLNEVFVISRIIEVEVAVLVLQPKAEADNPYRDLDYSGYHKNRI